LRIICFHKTPHTTELHSHFQAKSSKAYPPLLPSALQIHPQNKFHPTAAASNISLTKIKVRIPALHSARHPTDVNGAKSGSGNGRIHSAAYLSRNCMRSNGCGCNRPSRLRMKVFPRHGSNCTTAFDASRCTDISHLSAVVVRRGASETRYSNISSSLPSVRHRVGSHCLVGGEFHFWSRGTRPSSHTRRSLMPVPRFYGALRILFDRSGGRSEKKRDTRPGNNSVGKKKIFGQLKLLLSLRRVSQASYGSIKGKRLLG